MINKKRTVCPFNRMLAWLRIHTRLRTFNEILNGHFGAVFRLKDRRPTKKNFFLTFSNFSLKYFYGGINFVTER
jgi:hypothetical protein